MKKVKGIKDGQELPGVELEGEKGLITAEYGVVVATDGPAASGILDSALLDAAPSKASEGVGTCCLYFRYVHYITNENWTVICQHTNRQEINLNCTQLICSGTSCCKQGQLLYNPKLHSKAEDAQKIISSEITILIVYR